MTRETELAPCPFCGGAGRLWERGELWHVECVSCRANTAFGNTTESATHSWNRRAAAALATQEFPTCKQSLQVATQAPPEPAGEMAALAERCERLACREESLLDSCQLTIESHGKGFDRQNGQEVIDVLREAAAALTTPPQPLDGVLREFVAWAERSKDVDYLNGESDIHSGDAWVHLDELVLRAQSALRVIGAPEIGRPSASPS